MSIAEVKHAVLGERQAAMDRHPLDPGIELVLRLLGISDEDPGLPIEPIEIGQLPGPREALHRRWWSGSRGPGNCPISIGSIGSPGASSLMPRRRKTSSIPGSGGGRSIAACLP